MEKSADAARLSDAFRSGDLCHDLVGGVFIQVEHGIGDLPAGFVDHFLDVDVGVAQDAADLGDQAGHIAVDDREAGMPAGRERAGREVDGIADRAGLQVEGPLCEHRLRIGMVGRLGLRPGDGRGLSGIKLTV